VEGVVDALLSADAAGAELSPPELLRESLM
jgi:hypothetical protein